MPLSNLEAGCCPPSKGLGFPSLAKCMPQGRGAGFFENGGKLGDVRVGLEGPFVREALCLVTLVT